MNIYLFISFFFFPVLAVTQVEWLHMFLQNEIPGAKPLFHQTNERFAELKAIEHELE